MDGFSFLRLVRARQPTPVLVVSSHARGREVMRALELGAFDFIAKPEAGDERGLASLRRELLGKLASVRALRLENLREPRAAPGGAPAAAVRAGAPPRRVVVVGASIGGPAAVSRLLAALPADLPAAYAVAQHMPERFTRSFAERLARQTGLDAREAEDGDELLEGRVLVAPGGRHLALARRGPLGAIRARVTVAAEGDGRRYCPSVDALFESAAQAMGRRLCAVVLTGMGDDGRRGAARVKEAGGLVLAESEGSAVVFGMPREVVESGSADEVLSLDGLAARLRRFAAER
jgi:two-component system chemotaxis response regulator CheB